MSTIAVGIKRLTLPVIAVSMLCVPAAAQAAICTWTGAGADTHWSTAANWTGCGGAAPQDGDALVFPAGAAGWRSDNDIANLSLASIAITGVGVDNVRYLVTGLGVTLTTAAGVLFDAPADGAGFGPRFLAQITLASSLGVVNTGAATASLGVIAANGFNATFDTANANITTGVIYGPGSIEKNGASVLSIASNHPSGPTPLAAVNINTGTVQTAELIETTSVTIQTGAVWESLSLHQRTSVIAAAASLRWAIARSRFRALDRPNSRARFRERRSASLSERSASTCRPAAASHSAARARSERPTSCGGR